MRFCIKITLFFILFILIGCFGISPFLADFWNFMSPYISTPVGVFSTASALAAVIGGFAAIFRFYLVTSPKVSAEIRFKKNCVSLRLKNSGKLIARDVKIEFEPEFLVHLMNIKVSDGKETISSMMRLLSNKRNIDPEGEREYPICFARDKFFEAVTSNMAKTKITVSWKFGWHKRLAKYDVDFFDEFLLDDKKVENDKPC